MIHLFFIHVSMWVSKARQQLWQRRVKWLLHRKSPNDHECFFQVRIQMQKAFQNAQMLSTSTPLGNVVSNYIKESAPHRGVKHYWGQWLCIKYKLGCLGCYGITLFPADQVQMSYSGVVFLKALGKCRWDRRQQTCVSPHDVSQRGKYLSVSTQVLNKWCE